MGGGGPSHITQTTQPPAYLSQFIGQLQPYMSQVGTGALNPMIPNDMPLVAPINPLVDLGNMFNMNYALGPQHQAMIGQMQGGLNQSFGGFDPRLNGLYGATTPLSGILSDALAGIVGGAPGMGAAGLSLGGGPGGYMSASRGGTLPPPDPAELQNLIDRSSEDMTRAFERADLANIRGAAIDAGQFGSNRQGIVEGIAQEGLGKAILKMSSDVRMNDYEQERNRQAQLAAAQMQVEASAAGAGQNALIAAGNQRLQAIQLLGQFMGQGSSQGFDSVARAVGMAPTIAQYPLSIGNMLTGMGSGYMQHDQQVIDANMNRYLQNNSVTMRDLGFLGGLINGTGPGNFGTTSSTNPNAGGGGWGGAATGAMTGLAMTSTMFGTAGAGATAALGLSNPVGWAVLGLAALAGAFA